MYNVSFDAETLIEMGRKYDQDLKNLERFLTPVSTSTKRALARTIMGLVEQPGTAPGSRRLQGVGAAFCLPHVTFSPPGSL